MKVAIVMQKAAFGLEDELFDATSMNNRPVTIEAFRICDLVPVLR